MSERLTDLPVVFTDEIRVELVRHMAADDYVIQAAQVSSKGENKPDTVPARLIKALLAGRHGSPFEHTAFTFFVEAPIFVFREWMRHRISSFNEWSGRYSTLSPKFYIPSAGRPMINIGTSMKPKMVPIDESGYLTFVNNLKDANREAWEAYVDSVNAVGVATEVARAVLPVNIYSQMYWTVNARSLMNFLSLRVESDESLVRSYPQLEIQMAAERIEDIFRTLMPLTHKAFVENGRVAP